MAKIIDDTPKPTMKDRAQKVVDGVQGGQVWSSIFRPGSIFRKGYSDSPRNRSYVIMVRDLGSLREPAAYICIGSTIVFLGLCGMLHRRDRIVTANLSRKALAAG